MKKTSSWLAGIIFLASLIPAVHAGDAAGAGPKEIVASINREIAAEVEAGGDGLLADNKQRVAVVDQVASQHTDFDYMAQLVLGNRWGSATVQQRAKFIDQFRTLLLWTFAEQVVEHVDGQTQYSTPQTNASGTVALVRTQVWPSTGPAKSVNYRLRAIDGAWKVFDVAVDGISIVSMYRRTFMSEVKKGGIDNLIARLTKKNKHLIGT